ncbi:porin family protein [Winogradskyella bathintestinalis]|uniref:Curli production assembly/transport component CsgG n=1 Tax=Winogradskyella bathintestinalis TaxID=3035208 RepID=A0ABT7ZUR1_9FLAO|nr:Curli production assembly/transport component CsgG [Winogradskyella bathintestinalis]MDN3492712.1 Curli production assembly/transport component CsgG [Winogradskyella bathintestinalis]
MISNCLAKIFFISFAILSFNSVWSQQSDIKSQESIRNKYTFFEHRGTHAIDAAVGSAKVDGDYSESEFDLYFRVGYKYHLTSHLNVNISYNKYNVVVKDVFNEGYMSFDLNLEFLLSPYSKFTPYLYIGGGYNAANYFENTATKAQGGLGFEYIITDGVGVKLFSEYNLMFTDELDGNIAEDGDDTLIRVGLGLNFYFGGNKKKEALRRKMKTVINSNLIVPYN